MQPGRAVVGVSVRRAGGPEEGCSGVGGPAGQSRGLGRRPLSVSRGREAVLALGRGP